MNIKRFNLNNIVAVILFILILTKVKLLNFLDSDFSSKNLIIISFFVFSIVGILGIFLQKHWGYFATYIFILISSIALGVAPIPFVVNLFPINAATYLVIITSIILFLITLFLQIKLVKNVNKKTT